MVIFIDAKLFPTTATLGRPRNERSGSLIKPHPVIRLHPHRQPVALPMWGAPPNYQLRRRPPKINGWMEHLVWDIILRHHKASGLYESCLQSNITIQQAEEMILEKLMAVGIKQSQLIIAGNSVHMDKLFMYHHMPMLYAFLDSNILDVSSIKLFVNAKNPYLFYKK